MITFETKYLRYSIDDAGNNVEFVEKATGRNILKSGFNPCSKIVRGEKDRTEYYPIAAVYEAPYLCYRYAEGFQVRVLVGIHENYLTFALKSVSPQSFWSVAAIQIAVDVDYVRDSSYGATLMGMTLRTRMKEYPGRNSLLLAEAYTHIGLADVKCAVIGAPEPVLNGIMREVLDEIPDGAMPKAAYSGPYACECPDASRTYTITGVITNDTVDAYVEKMKKFSISQVHIHQGAMYSQGDFTVSTTYFPDGREGFKRMIARLHEHGIQAMLHSYTFFVQSVNAQVGNKYLAPIPHKDLGVCHRYTLAEDMSADADFIPSVENTENVSTIFGYNVPATNLLWIDDEIIRFRNVGKNGFTEITRGTFGSTISEHKAGSEIKQLNSYFGYIAPEKGSDLFYEIARNNAEFYNEMDFDGYYFDAIDGVFVLDGNEFAWYHAVDFINEVFKYQKKAPIFNCCYGPQYPGQWYARTRMGAFDTPHRGYRDFADVHVNFNEKFAERMYLIGELGWWSLYPGANDNLGWSNKVMYDEDVDYICTKMLATDVCQCWHGSFAGYPEIPILAGYSDKINLYTKLKEERYFDKETKAILRKPYSEFELVECGGAYKFRPTFTDYYKVESIEEGRNTWTANNRYKAQAPKIRIEALRTADNYDCAEGDVIFAFDEEKPVALNEPVMLGNFDAKDKRGIGVWIRGDGKGEVINLRFRSPNHVSHGDSDHFIRVNFTGWRYFSFYEFENCEMKHEDWEPRGLDYKVFTDVGKFYAAYSSPVNYSNLETLNVMVNREGDFDIRLKPVKALPAHKIVLNDPTLTIGGQTITFRTALQSDTFLEYDPATGKAVVYDYKGFVQDTPEVVGAAPVMQEGDNEVKLTVTSDSPYQKRAAVTLRCFGETI